MTTFIGSRLLAKYAKDEPDEAPVGSHLLAKDEPDEAPIGSRLLAKYAKDEPDEAPVDSRVDSRVGSRVDSRVDSRVGSRVGSHVEPEERVPRRRKKQSQRKARLPKSDFGSREDEVPPAVVRYKGGIRSDGADTVSCALAYLEEEGIDPDDPSTFEHLLDLPFDERAQYFDYIGIVQASKERDSRLCPICDSPAQSICNCNIQAMTCQNGHCWSGASGKIFSDLNHSHYCGDRPISGGTRVLR